MSYYTSSRQRPIELLRKAFRECHALFWDGGCGGGLILGGGEVLFGGSFGLGGFGWTGLGFCVWWGFSRRGISLGFSRAFSPSSTSFIIYAKDEMNSFYGESRRLGLVNFRNPFSL